MPSELENVARIKADATVRAAQLKADAMDRAAAVNASAMNKTATVNASAMDRAATVNASAMDRAAAVKASAMDRQTTFMGRASYAYWLQGFGVVFSSAALLYVGYRFHGAANRYSRAQDCVERIGSLAAGPEHLRYSQAMSRIYEHRNGFPDISTFHAWFASEINSGKRASKWNQLNDDRTVCLEYMNQVQFAKLNAAALSAKRSGWAVESFKRVFDIPDERKMLQIAMDIFEKTLTPKKGYQIVTGLSKLFDTANPKYSDK